MDDNALTVAWKPGLVLLRVASENAVISYELDPDTADAIAESLRVKADRARNFDPLVPEEEAVR